MNNLVEAVASGLDGTSVRKKISDLELELNVLQKKIDVTIPKKQITRDTIIADLSKDIAELKSNPAYIKDLIKKYIVSVVVTEDTIEIISTADLSKAAKTAELQIKSTCNHSEDMIASATGCGGRI